MEKRDGLRSRRQEPQTRADLGVSARKALGLPLGLPAALLESTSLDFLFTSLSGNCSNLKHSLPIPR